MFIGWIHYMKMKEIQLISSCAYFWQSSSLVSYLKQKITYCQEKILIVSFFITENKQFVDIRTANKGKSKKHHPTIRVSLTQYIFFIFIICLTDNNEIFIKQITWNSERQMKRSAAATNKQKPENRGNKWMNKEKLCTALWCNAHNGI